MRIIDLTHCITEDMPVFPGTDQPKLEATSTCARDGFAETRLTLFSHTGTHIDAPAHIYPAGTTLDAFPAAQFVGKALIVDCTHVPAGGRIGMECIDQALAGQADFLPAEKAGGNHKTKSASAFPAGQNCRMREFHGIDSADDHAGVFAGYFSAECPEAVQRGQNILGEVYIGDHAGACGQARTDKQAVCHALGGWCLDSATSL